jgi:polyhydroxyalkanoate synthesis regulator phasin
MTTIKTWPERLPAHSKGPDFDIQEDNYAMEAEIDELRARVAELEKQLPPSMKNCTIVFKECDKGHGWLTATNWVQHDCQQCKAESQDKLLEQAMRDMKAAKDYLGATVTDSCLPHFERVLKSYKQSISDIEGRVK